MNILRPIALALLIIAGLSACLGTIREDGAQGSGASGGVNGQGGNVSNEVCTAPADGYCDQEEDCACTACAQAAAGCNDGYGCIADGLCFLGMEDACVCSDCDHSIDCISNCVLDNVCDPQSEGCGCGDCFSDPLCADNANSCIGTPNGICESGESCDCNDCITAESCACVPSADGLCDFSEPCTCPDCADSVYCAFECNNDGVCSGGIEGCGCVDCQDEPLCQAAIAACDNGIIDGVCDLGNDSCICPDCIGNPSCMCQGGACDLAEAPCFCDACDVAAFCIECVVDGVCDPLAESCACADCFGNPACTNNLQACDNNDTPNGVCSPGETCQCSDCMLTNACMCGPLADGTCTFGLEGCFCADCVGTFTCQDCYADGFCAAGYEACDCADCSSIAPCVN